MKAQCYTILTTGEAVRLSEDSNSVAVLGLDGRETWHLIRYSFGGLVQEGKGAELAALLGIS